jgi:hypothetical protein
MVNVKKVIMSMCVIMMVMYFNVGYSYSQEKPKEEVMKSLIMEFDTKISYKMYGKEFTMVNFDITNSFF